MSNLGERVGTAVGAEVLGGEEAVVRAGKGRDTVVGGGEDAGGDV